MAGVLPTGLGNDQQALQATAYVRQQPWYLQWLASQGIQPGPDQQVRLSDPQRTGLYQLMLQHGIGLNDKYDQVDENGQISEAHHKLRNTLIGAGIAGAALTGVGAAGIGPLAGAFGGGAGAASAAGGGVSAGLPGELAALPAVGAGAGSAAAGGAGILGTASKLIGFDPKNPKSYLDLAGKVGDTLGAAGQGAAQGRIEQTLLNQRQDALAQDQYQNRIKAPQTIAANSVKGDILANAKDFAYGAPTMVGNIPVPTSTGGLRPSIFSDNTRALGTRMSADALATPGAPELTPMDTAGTGTSILNTAGTIGAFADLLNPDLYKTKIPYKRPAQGVVT